MVNLTTYNISIVLAVCLGSYTYGFSFAVFGTSIGEPGFYLYFDLDPKSSRTASILGAIAALFCAGAAIGTVVQGYTGDWLGRRKALAIAGAISLLGTAVVAGSVNLPMLFVFRFISGLGVGQLMALVPLYIAEVAPPHRRGLLTGGTACGLSIGYLTSAWIGYGTYFAKSLTVQWRMPLCLCPISPLLLLIGIWFIPESPRWLIWDGQNDKAWQILQRIHHDPTDAQDLAAHAEFIQVKKQVVFDKEIKTGWVQMFTNPTWRKRTLLAFLVVFAIQSAGINVITTYLILEAELVGLTGSMPLLIYAVYVVIAISMNFVNAYLLDIIGRKILLVTGLIWTGTCLFALTLLEWKFRETANKAGNAAAILFIMLYGFAVGFFLDPTQFAFCAEIFPTTIRAKGLTVSLCTYFVGTIIYTAPGPKAFADIEQWYYLVFVGCNIVSVILLAKYMPETKGLTLEEMGDLFGDTVVTHMTADGHGLVEVDPMTEFKQEGLATEVEHSGGLGYGDEKVVVSHQTAIGVEDCSV